MDVIAMMPIPSKNIIDNPMMATPLQNFSKNLHQPQKTPHSISFIVKRTLLFFNK